MKNIIKFFFFSTLLAVAIASCKKDETKDYFTGGTAPVLTASTNAVALSFANADKQALNLSWTNPNYQFTTGVSSQDVSYLIEIDTTGANFTNPQKQSVAVSKDMSQSFIVSQFNDYLLNQLLLKPGVQHNLDVRVKSSLANNSVTLMSNVIKLTATPYAIPPKVDTPASGKLYITGAATPASWMTAGDPELVNQRFTHKSSTLYELTINLTGGVSYLFVPVYGDWGAKYGGTGSNNANNPDGDDFKPNGGDLLAPAVSGTYKIQVDFQRGKFSVVKQ